MYIYLSDKCTVHFIESLIEIVGDTSPDIKELVITNNDQVEKKPVATMQESDSAVNLSLPHKG